MSLRRDIPAILAAHEFDPLRKELYVEGHSDRLFLKWVAGTSKSKDALILEISWVEIDSDTDGGNRGRLITFAESIAHNDVNIRCFVDRDYDDFVPEGTPEHPWNTLVTDGRDMESYFLREDCFEKITLLAIGTERYEGNQLLQSLLSVAREIACVRLYSILQKLHLAFQATNMRRSVSFDPNDGVYLLDLRRLVASLLQNTDISLTRRDEVINGAKELCEEIKDMPDVSIAHGKDVVALLGIALNSHDISREAAHPILRTSFERAKIAEYPNLASVLQYLTGE